MTLPINETGFFTLTVRPKSLHVVAQTNRLPFDRPVLSEPYALREPQGERRVEGLKANGDMLKSCDFSAHAEPFDRRSS